MYTYEEHFTDANATRSTREGVDGTVDSYGVPLCPNVHTYTLYMCIYVAKYIAVARAYIYIYVHVRDML